MLCGALAVRIQKSHCLVCINSWQEQRRKPTKNVRVSTFTSDCKYTNTCAHEQVSALYLAAQKNRSKIVKLLVENGADPCHRVFVQKSGEYFSPSKVLECSSFWITCAINVRQSLLLKYFPMQGVTRATQSMWAFFVSIRVCVNRNADRGAADILISIATVVLAYCHPSSSEPWNFLCFGEGHNTQSHYVPQVCTPPPV